jgi:hypothetical protein
VGSATNASTSIVKIIQVKQSDVTLEEREQEMANLKFYCKVTEVLPGQQGTNRNGTPWYSQSFIVEELGTNYPSKAMFVLWNKALTQENVSKLGIGNEVTISFNISHREWTGTDGDRKFSTELRVWKIEDGDTTEQVKPAQKQEDEDFQPYFVQVDTF